MAKSGQGRTSIGGGGPFSKFRAWGSNWSRRGRERLRSKLQGNDQEVGSYRRRPEAELEHQVPDRKTGRLPPGELQHKAGGLAGCKKLQGKYLS